MPPEAVHLLIVEDNPADARLLGELVGELWNPACSVHVVESLSAAIEYLADNAVGLVVLDLNLPDSVGLGTLGRIREQAPELPVVVLTGVNDEELGENALVEGALDYLPKSELNEGALRRTIRYTLARSELLRRERENYRNEVQLLGEMSRAAAAPVTARRYSAAPLRERVPVEYRTLVRSYGEVLEQILAARVYDSPREYSEALPTLATALGQLRAGPRDVIDIHLDALAEKQKGANPKRLSAYVDEGRVLALEFMGHLVLYYRRNCVPPRDQDQNRNAASEEYSR